MFSALHRALDIPCTQYITTEVKIGLKCPPQNTTESCNLKKGLTTEYYSALKKNELLIHKKIGESQNKSIYYYNSISLKL